MEGDIPSVDIRIRAKQLENKGVEDLRDALDDFNQVTGLVNSGNRELFLKAILLVSDPDAFKQRDDNLTLEEEEQKMLELDSEPEKPDSKPNTRFPQFWRYDRHKWGHLPWPLWRIILLCAIGAVVQGWDEAAVNGAQQWYQAAFQKFIDVPSGLSNAIRPQPGIVGLINGAPYLCCVLSCWLTPFLNDKLGRRGTIFLCAIFSVAFAFAQAFAQTWWELLIYRLLMGIGKSLLTQQFLPRHILP